MPRRSPDDESLKEFADSLKELMEIQKEIDESAYDTVKNVRTLVDHRAEYAPVRAADYPDHDAAYYDGTGNDLTAEGVRTLGDFEDAAFSRRNPDKHAFVRLGLAEDGTIGAMWFRLGQASSLALHSWLEDGRTLVTGRAASESHVPNRPELVSERLGLETSARDLARRHRSRVGAAGSLPRLLRGLDDLLAAYAADEKANATFREREGLALFEPMFRANLGDRYDEEGEPLVQAIRAHPEWWTGEAPPPQQSPSTEALHLMFLASREDDGRSHLTTAGLMMHGLPELQMKAVAGNHSRAARFLMSVVARKLARDVAERPLPAGLELALTRADVALPNQFVALGRYPEVEVEETTPARVQLVLEGFGGNRGLFALFKSDPELLHLIPPADYQGNKDEWLREACRRLGQDAPAPLVPDALESQMQAASRKAKATLGEVRERFQRGLPGDYALVIKLGLTTTQGGREYVWVRVVDWTQDGVLIGTLETEPHDVPGFMHGQEMRVREGDVFDRAIVSKEQGMVEAAATDIVAQEFGVDL